MQLTGTSPRTRGKLSHVALTPDYEWNIPAHAGKTLGVAVEGLIGPEHPRARGENYFPDFF